MRVIKQFVVFICLCLQCLAAGEDGAQPAVATVGGREGETLLRRVDTVHLRTYADHVEEGVFLQE